MAEKNTKPVQGPGGRGPKGPRPKVENPGKLFCRSDRCCSARMWTCDPASEKLCASDTPHGDRSGCKHWIYTCMAVNSDRSVF